MEKMMMGEVEKIKKGKDCKIAVGLMSGTSLDGIDAALCQITGHGFDTKVQLIAFETYPFEKKLKEKIRQACFKESSSVDLLCSLNFELGYAFSQAVRLVLKQAKMTDADLDFIASHGQTLYHQPFADDTHIPSTLQLGEAAVIAYEHQCPVISNFRVMDMAAGGQGAPVVPYSEFILYSQKNKNIALLNIGGIGNVTWLNGSMDASQIQAFDTGPGNMMINAAMKKLYGKDYDRDGMVAASGKLVQPLLSELQQDPYFDRKPPKSTGRELFGENRTAALLEKYQAYSKEDLVYTFTYFTAWSVAWHVHQYLEADQPLSQLIVGGGGVHNQTLMKLLKEEMPNVQVFSQEEIGLNSDAKEAIAFVVMGNETLRGYASNIPSATGAKEAVILGNITPAPRRKERK